MLAALISGCSQSLETRMDALFYTQEGITMSKHGTIDYGSMAGQYDLEREAKACTVKQASLPKITTYEKIEIKNSTPNWLVYIGKPANGVAYGYLQPEKIEISYKEGSIRKIQSGSIQKLREAFDYNCMQESAGG